jgi:hypothetical protein
MFMDIIILFIILAILFFIISVYLVEGNPSVSIPFIMLGMIFCVLCTYGLWNVEVLYVGYNATSGLSETNVYTVSYGDPYSYIFMLLFMVFTVLFVRAGFNMWREALKTEGQMDYKKLNKRR